MELEELQQHWRRLEEKLDRSIQLEGELLRQAIVTPARRRLLRWMFWPSLDILFGLVVALIAGSVLGNHWPRWSLVGPASVVLLAAILLLIDSIVQLHRVSEIDWSRSVSEIQQSLARMQLAKIRQFKYILLLSPLVGFSALIVGLQCLLDRLPQPHFILDKLNPWWVAGNYVFGVVFLLVGHLFVRFLASRFQHRLWWRRVLADLSGTSMTQIHEELQRWAEFESVPSR